MFRAGITMPLLQVELFGASGRRYFVDFWWPEFRVIGEFDGKDKYRNPVFFGGRTAEQALISAYDGLLTSARLLIDGTPRGHLPAVVPVDPGVRHVEVRTSIGVAVATAEDAE